jgi:hypothetical protein
MGILTLRGLDEEFLYTLTQLMGILTLCGLDEESLYTLTQLTGVFLCVDSIRNLSTH